MVPARMNFLTLACRDVDRMARFFRALGWPEAPSSEPDHRVFQLTNGVALALYAASNYEASLGGLGEGFRGFTLGINVGSRSEVVDIHAQLEDIEGIQALEEPVDSVHGFTGFGFRDPEGNVWDVVWAHDSEVAPDGSLTWG